MIGQTLSHYRITEKLGAGGMGEVYRATDTRLGREVALKVLPPAFSTHADRIARFDREAKLLSTLNHPNIASLYGVEDANGIRALVMELVEGPTLANRLQAGPVPLEDALGIGKQIVEALEAAHERGIIHRDLKPANIKITPEGRVKVLDFGLARAMEDDPAADSDQSPTLSALATKAGIILGTAAYMSPEQAKGKPCDRRADVWSFGVVLYEMLAGRQLYAGETPSEILAAVIKEEPDWSALPADTPPAIRKLLRRCLTKDPKRRLQSIGEARIAIEEYAAAPGGESVMISGVAMRPAGWRQALPWAIAGVFIFTTAVLVWSPWRTPVNPSPPMRLSADVGADAALNLAFGAAAVLSPDGTHLAFVGRGADRLRLYLRRMDRTEAQPLSGTEGAVDPFFSPDGQWVAYFAEGKLKKVAVQGGASVTLCGVQQPRGGSWSEDGTIVFTLNTQGGMFRVSSAGGAPQQLTTPDKERGEITHRWPQVLPGGKAAIFTASRLGNFEESRILSYSFQSGETKEIHVVGMYPRYMPAGPDRSRGYLLYIHEGTMFAAPFDIEKLEMTAPPAPVLEGVVSNTGTGGGQFAFSDSGTLVYVPGSSFTAGLPLFWLDAQGKLQPLRDVLASYSFPRFSPDGKRLAVSVARAPGADIFIYDWERDTMSRLTVEGGRNWAPVWTPDGQRITYRTTQDAGAMNIYWRRADGTGAVERLTEGKYVQTPWSWSPDGKLLAFVEESPETGMDIWLLPMEGDERAGWKPGSPRVFANGPFIEGMPAISPDGRWLAYGSTETGTMEVYVQPIGASGGKWQVSSGGGGHPRWSQKKNELLYRGTDNRIMVVSYSVSGGSFLAGKPRVWSETTIAFRGAASTFDLHPDGKRFVLMKDPETARDSGASRVTLILNFPEEIRRRIPGGKKLGD